MITNISTETNQYPSKHQDAYVMQLIKKLQTIHKQYKQVRDKHKVVDHYIEQAHLSLLERRELLPKKINCELVSDFNNNLAIKCNVSRSYSDENCLGLTTVSVGNSFVTFTHRFEDTEFVIPLTISNNILPLHVCFSSQLCFDSWLVNELELSNMNTIFGCHNITSLQCCTIHKEESNDIEERQQYSTETLLEIDENDSITGLFYVCFYSELQDCWKL